MAPLLTTVSDLEMRDVVRFVDVAASCEWWRFLWPFSGGHCPMQPGATQEGAQVALGRPTRGQGLALLFLVLAHAFPLQHGKQSYYM